MYNEIMRPAKKEILFKFDYVYPTYCIKNVIKKGGNIVMVYLIVIVF